LDHAEFVRAIVSSDTIADSEIGDRTPLPNSLTAISAALDAAGGIVVDEAARGKASGAGSVFNSTGIFGAPPRDFERAHGAGDKSETGWDRLASTLWRLMRSAEERAL
jgi:hypothetical protein